MTFQLGDLDIGVLATTNGRPSVLAPAPLKGCGSVITIAPRCLRRIQHALDSGDRNLETFYHVDLAVSIVHELAHAAKFAGRRVQNDQQHYLPGCASSEEGFELEAAIFGGCIELISAGSFAGVREDGKEGMLASVEWPTPTTVNGYESDGQSYMGCRRELPAFDRAWEIEPAFLYGLLTDSFWDGVEEHGIQALRPQRGTCWILDQGCWIWVREQ